MNWTPSTGRVRDAYIRAMRNAFIASAGEHAEEFDRWLAQVKREAAADALEEAARGWDGGPYRAFAQVLRARAASIRSGATS